MLPITVRLKGKRQASVIVYASRREDKGQTVGFILHLIDTTEQKRLEAQFAQSQKMQAVGLLAGGIAHDFNNLLTAMIGFCDLLLLRHRAGDQSFADIMQIKQNANRAANLVRQLLAFSRQQTLQPRVLQVTDVLAEVSHLLRRLIGENIELGMVHGRDLQPVRVDQGQLEQVIINLAVNARDAMPNGGAPAHQDRERRHQGPDPARRRGDAARPLRDDRDRRYRHRHPAGDHGPHLRAVLLHQVGRLRHRPRPLHRLRHRAPDRRLRVRRQHDGRGRDLPHLPAGAPGRSGQRAAHRRARKRRRAT